MIGTLTNELNLPEPIVQAIKGHDYSYLNRDPAKRSCDFTTTQLIAPVRITTLLGKYGQYLIEDASARIFALFGNAIHSILETANDRISPPRYLVEKRFYADFSGGRVGGRIDVFDLYTETLDDYKICSRYVVGDGIKPEWTAQASINALLMKLDAGLDVRAARIIAMFRDWSVMAARRQKDYPQRQVVILPIRLWNFNTTLQYVQERISALRTAEQIGPPVCTPDERWRKSDQFALIKKGNKKAKKLFDSEIEAQAALNELENRDDYQINPRPGEDTRCLNYCPVTAYCSYFHELMESMDGHEK